MKNVNRNRIHLLNGIETHGTGDFYYWMYREQRLDDNWALNFALELSCQYKRGLQVLFFGEPSRDESHTFSREFMIQGLEQVKKRAEELNIPFTCIVSQFIDQDLLDILSKNCAAGLICDFNPLREYLELCQTLSKKLTIPFWEVDGHNIIPCRFLSHKQEYAAHTIRRKIEPLLSDFLVEYPSLEETLSDVNGSGSLGSFNPVNGISSLKKIFEKRQKKETGGHKRDLLPGYQQGMKRLYRFLKEDLDSYNTQRNDPVAHVVSGLSPYLHFGQISAQTVAFEAAKYLGFLSLKGGFLDEIIVRRELADNFCLHNDDYDSFDGFPQWAQLTLRTHENDQREYLYDLGTLESAKTHDLLWNAAQRQMVTTGIMHGYMRMYWAKKILEWTIDARTAMTWAVYLNDKYSLDGKDPNGYAGCAWAIGGVHDRPWGERAVFGKIRYMNARGCDRKFNTKKYIEEVSSYG